MTIDMELKIRKTNFISGIFIIFIAMSFFSCENEKAERKLIGDWEVVNSLLTTRDSGKIIHQVDHLGTISFEKNKIDETLIDLNFGTWSFESFPDTIVPLKGNLSWTSTDKGEYQKMPWVLNLFFSTHYVEDPNLKGATKFNCYEGIFDVTEIKKKSHYRISGYILMTDRPYYNWVFELKKK